MDYEKKINSKFYRFFDFVYKLLIMNLLTFFLSLLVVTFIPAVVAMNATIKYDMDETNPFKAYFRNFKTYFKKSFLINLLLIAILGIVGFSFYFYSYAVFSDEVNQIISQMGIVVMIVLGLVIIMIGVHIPLITITFPSLTVMEIIKTCFYISFRYFLTTLILTGMFVLKIVGLIAFPIWIIIGISLPTFLGVKFTKPVYYKFEKIDLEKIMHEVEEEFDE